MTESKKVSIDEGKKILEKGKTKRDIDKNKEAMNLLNIRNKLERDYKEDVLEVEFRTSAETLRKVKARRPSQKEMVEILRLSYSAATLDSNPKSIDGFLELMDKMPKIAAKLSVDPALDEDFWSNLISHTSLQEFINNLIEAVNKGYVSEEEMKSFR